mmetsp:Transcript_45376/g.33161  ORF Transcript_45376/g.33161 Transcript_45376/m.33161 type:complete len:269 (+) Transcript_45376:178-984(+)
MNQNYLLMEPKDLQVFGVKGWRLSIAELVRTRLYDIFVILLIIIYTLLIFVYFALDGTEVDEDEYKVTLYAIEIVILAFFVFDITLHVLAFWLLYLSDWWNIFDLVVILLSIVFVVADMKVDNDTVKNILKIRGIFRLLRVFLLIRKLNVLRVKRDIQKKKRISGHLDLRSPLERVLEILSEIRDRLDYGEDKTIEDLNYCIKMISSSKLYEANFELELGESAKTQVNKDMILLYNQYSQHQGGSTEKRNSLRRGSKLFTLHPFSGQA